MYSDLNPDIFLFHLSIYINISIIYSKEFTASVDTSIPASAVMSPITVVAHLLGSDKSGRDKVLLPGYISDTM